jgi:hypothetical protein
MWSNIYGDWFGAIIRVNLARWFTKNVISGIQKMKNGVFHKKNENMNNIVGTPSINLI